MKNKICIVTGGRAEYGLLYPLLKEIKADAELQLQVIATGMHLSPEFGLTYKLIEADGFNIDSKVEMILSSDTAVGVAKSIGLGIIGFADALENLNPSVVIVLGDRYEIFAAAQAAMILQIPLVHIAGGDNGLGTYDNIIRHCITKIASLHFVTHEDARRRVIQLGENQERVYCFGALNVDNILEMPLLSRDELVSELEINLKKIIFLVTFHPLTMDMHSAEDQLETLLIVLTELKKEIDCQIIFTKSNADNGGRNLNHVIENYLQKNSDCYLFDSLGQMRYLSLVKIASAVIGNSSSGIYEAPYLKTPCVDIGSRQQGRAAPVSVIRCEADPASIRNSILASMKLDFEGVEMIYGHGGASKKILKKIKEFINTPGLVIKEFFDLEKP
jgi:UDP-N-acetylglucosamine 2-epimerase (non-hydrolysing)/GDP/UDP-N,N'-diacetylbacillosamine 2-epimerase (hydrolysing)